MNSWTKRGAAALATGILAASLTACGGQDTGKPSPHTAKTTAGGTAKHDDAAGLKGVSTQAGAGHIGRGSSGAKVRCVQLAVNWLQSPDVAVDGVYGAKTAGAVSRYQGREHIARDGIVGPVTSRHLHADVHHLAYLAVKYGEHTRVFSNWLAECPGLMP